MGCHGLGHRRIAIRPWVSQMPETRCAVSECYLVERSLNRMPPLRSHKTATAVGRPSSPAACPERRGLRPVPGATPAPAGVALRRRYRATPCQTELDVTLCFAPLLRWVLCWWRSGGLALAIDPTLKGDQTTAIVIRGIPGVAWHIRPPTSPAPGWTPPWNCKKPQRFPRICRHRALRPGHCQSQAVAGIKAGPVCATERTSLSSDGQTIAGPARLPSRYGVEPRHRLQFAKAQRRCTPGGRTPNEDPGSPHRPCTRSGGSQLVRPAPGSSWASRPSRAGLEVGQDAAHRPHPRLPALARPVGGHPGPWPMAPGWRTPRSGGLLQATCGTAQSAGSQSP